MKIISLVPSITELLFDLGLKDDIIGRTKFCVHPKESVQRIPQFGGTKNLHIDKIRQAQPHLIIANKEENLKHEIEMLQKDFEVMVTDVSTLEDNNQMILDIGARTGTSKAANQLVMEIQYEFMKLDKPSTLSEVLYLIWNNPLMTIGHDTFIHHMLQYAGFENIARQWKRYPEITKEMDLQPAYVMLSSEPFPFKEKHKIELQKQFPQSQFVFVDGEMFSWYGSRMRKAPNYFLELRNQIKA